MSLSFLYAAALSCALAVCALLWRLDRLGAGHDDALLASSAAGKRPRHETAYLIALILFAMLGTAATVAALYRQLG